MVSVKFVRKSPDLCWTSVGGVSRSQCLAAWSAAFLSAMGQCVRLPARFQMSQKLTHLFYSRYPDFSAYKGAHGDVLFKTEEPNVMTLLLSSPMVFVISLVILVPLRIFQIYHFRKV